VTKYRVYLSNHISTTVEVDVDSPDIDDIENAALAALPPSNGGVIFLDHTWPDSGEWYIEDDGYEEVK
jgi:hypothetical protein